MKSPDVLADGLWPLLEPVSAADDAALAPAAAARQRLLSRITRSASASRAMVTVRQHRASLVDLAPGVQAQVLYQSDAPVLRPGEPRRVWNLTLQPHAEWAPSVPGAQTEWLVVRGTATVGEQALGEQDYLVNPPGSSSAVKAGAQGACLYWRESPAAASGVELSRDEPAAWHDFAPGIRRRLLWVCGTQAAMLYRAEPGALVPHHGHGHDEECLMLQGDAFLDDMLLRAGEYQIAPAGTEHGSVSTDTGALIFAHGDLDLALISE